jgi:hypothetical protein
MAFGLRNTAQALQRLKDNILMGLDYVFSFLDDDGVFSKSKEEHWTHLRTLFAILAANGLALNLEKCVFAIPKLDFLGHRISAAGVAPLRDNVQVILDFPKPNDCKALQRFLAMINFYHRFLPGVTGMLRPLTAALSGNPKTLPWMPDMETAFIAAKKALVAAVPLSHPLPGALLAGGQPAASSPPGMYGKVSPQTSQPGQKPALAASGPKCTGTYRYLLNTSQYPPAVSAISTWTWWGPCRPPRCSPTCSLSLTGHPAGLRQFLSPPPQQKTAPMHCLRDG